MKLFLLAICCVIATSFAGQFSNTEEKILGDIEVLLQDLVENEPPTKAESFEDFTKPKSSDTMEEVLLYTENVDQATAEIESVGGQVSIQMGDNVLIAQIPSQVAVMQDTFAHASPQIPSTAPPTVQNKAEIYEMYREGIKKPKPKVQKWTEKTAPHAYPQLKPFEANSPYRLTMTGKIAVALVVPSGPGYLSFTERDYSHVVSQALGGLLNVWQRNAPPNVRLSFALYDFVAFIQAPDGRPGCSGAGCHDVFVIPALQVLGYNTRDNLAHTVKNWARADGAYIGFISKYRQHHFAYAYFGGGPLYMQFSNDGWGPGQIDRVFAHETGHVFNAPDEYTQCQCNTGYGKGVCTDRNYNCRSNDGSACTHNQQPCIMNTNDPTNICIHTRRHVGWC